LIVLGGGPAGLTAAVYTAREAIDTLVIERAAFGGQAAGTEKLDNMPGFPEGCSRHRFLQPAPAAGWSASAPNCSRPRMWSASTGTATTATVKTADGSAYTAKALLVATGSRYKRLNVPGESDYMGAGVHFCATCDGPFYKGRQVAVVGGGNSAAEESLLLTKFAERVTILVRGDAHSRPPNSSRTRCWPTPKSTSAGTPRCSAFEGAEQQTHECCG
jgi:thioredoxin reductase (NADPH)